jgi:hypothetical protein
MVVNGWDVACDNNRAKSVGAQLVIWPLAALKVVISGMTGPERTRNDADPRNLLDVWATFNASKRWRLAANADWSWEKGVVGPGRDGGWRGLAAYARYAATQAFAVSLRGEFFDDPDGLRTGVAQTLGEWTVTPELRLTPHMLVRGDVRVDHSDQAVFDNPPGLGKTQPTAMIEALYWF